MKQRIGILGTGKVAQTLAAGFLARGYPVALGSREKKAVPGWAGEVGEYADVARAAEIIIVAVKGTVAESVVEAVGAALAGKVVIDVTNPIADIPPTDGVIHFFTSLEDSLFERLIAKAPDARLVKAWNSVGSAFMVDPALGGTRPTMPICGTDGEAKRIVGDILEDFGWEVEDMGKPAAARAIEPLCMLWCIPGFLRGDWEHAFKLLRN